MSVTSEAILSSSAFLLGGAAGAEKADVEAREEKRG